VNWWTRSFGPCLTPITSVTLLPLIYLQVSDPLTASSDLDALLAFLPCATPKGWITAALSQQSLLLIDHANCEKKAAATAMSLLHRHTDQPELMNKMSRLAREELRHFEQVLSLMRKRDIDYIQVTASRYAGALHALVRKRDPERLVDTLLLGALIEARSCERFAAIAPHLDAELSKFYFSLLKSESRHFLDYLTLAKSIASVDEVDERLGLLRDCEKELIESEDQELRFHSGVPAAA
jgi:tRNA-(ms[2]io[6]A)-hydroxylase